MNADPRGRLSDRGFTEPRSHLDAIPPTHTHKHTPPPPHTHTHTHTQRERGGGGGGGGGGEEDAVAVPRRLQPDRSSNGEAFEGLGVIRRNLVFEGPKRKGAIHGARLQIEQVEALGEARGDGAFSCAGRSVDGDDNTLRIGHSGRFLNFAGGRPPGFDPNPVLGRPAPGPVLPPPGLEPEANPPREGGLEPVPGPPGL